MATLVSGLVSLLLALQWGGSKYQWTNARIIVLLILAGVLTIVWVGVQRWKQEDATVPPRLLKHRNLVGVILYAACVSGAFTVLIYYVGLAHRAIHWLDPANPVAASHLVPGGQRLVAVNVRGHERTHGVGHDHRQLSGRLAHYHFGIPDPLPRPGDCNHSHWRGSLLELADQLRVCPVDWIPSHGGHGVRTCIFVASLGGAGGRTARGCLVGDDIGHLHAKRGGRDLGHRGPGHLSEQTGRQPGPPSSRARYAAYHPGGRHGSVGAR